MSDCSSQAFSVPKHAKDQPRYILKCEKCGWPFATLHLNDKLCHECRESGPREG